MHNGELLVPRYPVKPNKKLIMVIALACFWEWFRLLSASFLRRPVIVPTRHSWCQWFQGPANTDFSLVA